MKRIIKKQIYKIEFELTSALSVGSGNNDHTDKDIILGSDGKPYIPASAIAGVCISALDGKQSPENKVYKEYWGYIKKAKKNDNRSDATESAIVFYDAYMCNDQKYEISTRDSVALDEYKNAIDGAKFDMEILEPGIKFVTYVEQSFSRGDEPELAKTIAGYFKQGALYFGSKTSRGYGSIGNVKIYRFEVDFESNNPDEREKMKCWALSSLNDLDWGAEIKNPNIAILESEVCTERTINIKLRQEGGISIRRYTTEVPKEEGKTMPDFTQLITKAGKPVIPGTTWAGAIERQMRKHLGDDINEDEWENTFGFVKNQRKQKSRIRFSESMLEDATRKQMSRTSIDRFSGGAADKSLFTEATYYGGTTELSIGIVGNLSTKIAQALAASIIDLHYGFLAIGGETSIGRGLFSIESIEDIDTTKYGRSGDGAEDFYLRVLELITGGKKGA